VSHDDPIVRELARHTCAAIPLGDPRRAVDYATRAAELAMVSLALEEAAGHYRRALRVANVLQPADEALSCRLLTRLGEVLAEADDPEAQLVLERAASAARRLVDPDLLAAIAGAMSPYGLTAGRFNPVVLSLAKDALGRVSAEPTATRARLLTVIASHSHGLDDPERRHTLLAEALTTAREVRDPLCLGQVLMSFQSAGWHPDNLGQRIAAADELAALAEQLEQPIFRLGAHHSQWSNLIETGNLKRAWAESDAIEREVGERDDDFGRLGICSRRAARLYLAGHLEAADQATAEMHQIAETIAPRRGLDPMSLSGAHLMVIRFTQWRIRELAPLIQGAAEANPSVSAYQAALAMTLARSGGIDPARRILRGLVANAAAALPRNAQWYAAMVCLADSAELIGDPDAAATLADQLEPYAGRLAVHGVGVSLPIDIALAQLALTTTDLEATVRIGERAANASRQMDTPIFLGRALVLQAVARARVAERARNVRPLLDEALAIAHRTGAHIIEHEAQRYQLL
jgi:hypothetical protein